MHLRLFMKLKNVKFDEIKPGIYFESSGNKKDPSEVNFFLIKKIDIDKNGNFNEDMLNFFAFKGKTWWGSKYYLPIPIFKCKLPSPIFKCNKLGNYLIFRKTLEENPFFIYANNVDNPNNLFKEVPFFKEIAFDRIQKQFEDNGKKIFYKFDENNKLFAFIIEGCKYNTHKTNKYRNLIELTASISLAEIENGIPIVGSINSKLNNHTFSAKDLTDSPFYMYFKQ